MSLYSSWKYAASSNDSALWQIDPGNPAALASVGPFSASGLVMEALAVNPTTNQLWGVDQYNRNIWTVNQANGLATMAASLPKTTVSFSTFGSFDFNVPANVSKLKATAQGAAGAGAQAGYGGIATTTGFVIPVTPGETLQINVGQRPTTSAGAFNGGGVGGLLTTPFNGGGGGTDIRRSPGTLADRILVAGGGGGAVSAAALGGNGGGVTGANGSGIGSGGGGSQTMGGFGGTAGGATGGVVQPGTMGMLFSGGTGALDLSRAGGGGGGGFYGGGGGAARSSNPNIQGGGGGGSAYAHPAFSSSVVYSVGSVRQTGFLTLEYTPFPALSDMTFSGDTCYAVDNASNLYILNLVTGALDRVGTSLLTSDYTGISMARFGTVFHMTTSQISGAVVRLWTVNPATGEPTFVADLTAAMSGYLISGLSFDASDRLWAVAFTSQTTGPSSLFLLSPSGGSWSATRQGTLPTSDNSKVLGTLAALPSACIHASSLVSVPRTSLDGIRPGIAIQALRRGDSVTLANGRVSLVKLVVKCGTRDPRSDLGHAHLCLVFEPHSLKPGVPSARFAVDPGHPICDPKDYATSGHLALRMARVWFTLAKPGTVTMTTWDRLHLLLPDFSDTSVTTELNETNDTTETAERSAGPLLRYDLVLEDGPTAYVANGVAVFSRHTLDTPGYDHSGGLF